MLQPCCTMISVLIWPFFLSHFRAEASKSLPTVGLLFFSRTHTHAQMSVLKIKHHTSYLRAGKQVEKAGWKKKTKTIPLVSSLRECVLVRYIIIVKHNTFCLCKHFKQLYLVGLFFEIYFISFYQSCRSAVKCWKSVSHRPAVMLSVWWHVKVLGRYHSRLSAD